MANATIPVNVIESRKELRSNLKELKTEQDR